MRSRQPKVLHSLCGRPMLAYVLDAAREALGGRPLVVYSPATEAILEMFRAEADFALQEEPLGTGDALRAALAALPPGIEEIVVLSGDVPLVRPTTVASVHERRRSHGAVMTITAARVQAPAGYGRVVRDGEGNDVARIVEERDATDDERAIDEINTGLYAFDVGWLRGAVGRLRPSAATGELYLTDLVVIARAEGRAVTALTHPEDRELHGINDRLQLARTEAELRRSICERHLAAGVTMRDPATAYIDATVELAADVILEPNVVLRGNTSVGTETIIGAGSQIVDSAIGERCHVWASVLESSEVADEVQIGPFAHLRPGSVIGRGAKLGNYAEVKNSRLGPGVQQHHFSYLGDADVGAGTNVGAGTITANYDGKRKLPTRIGERAFLGVDTMLVAPVSVGDGARTGAGAVVTRDVPAGKLAVGVPARIREPRASDDDPATTMPALES